jgi:cardiolipin synthase (CMP-forming)
MKGAPREAAAGRILTAANVITSLRILLIPVFVALIVDPDRSKAGLVLFGLVVTTDWIDGWVARRTDQVSDVGKLLDPVADRLAIAAGLIALMVRGAFPGWAGILILIRDAIVLLVGGYVLFGRRIKLEVRWIGKVATFSLMVAVVGISWGTLGLPIGAAAIVVGWVAFVAGIVEYYLAAAVYLGDVRHAMATDRTDDVG